MAIMQLDLFGNPIEIPVEQTKAQKAQAEKVKVAVVEEPVSLPLFEEAVLTATDSVVTAVATNAEEEFVYSNQQIRVKIKSAGRPKLPADRVVEKKKLKESIVKGKRGRKSYKEIDAAITDMNIPDDETLQQKQYYRIGKVSEWFGVNASQIRYWEVEFDILKPRLTRKGDRLFRFEDIKNLQLIYNLLRVKKLSIDGAKDYLKVNKNKADVQSEIALTLNKLRTFLIDLKSNISI